MRRVFIIVTCALLLSSCVGYLVFRAVGVQASTRKPPDAQVLLAARDLGPGALLREIDLKPAPWYGTVPKGALVKRADALNRAISASIYEGEVITESRLAQRGSGGGLAATIPPGMRACAVRVNDVAAVAGFAVPGMKVDVLITGMAPGSNALDGPQVRTLLQNLQVLSAGTHFQQDQEGKPEQAPVVNLLVTPEQAEILSLASNENHIQLVLRNPVDDNVAQTPGTIMSALFGGARVAAPQPPAAVHAVAASKPVPVTVTPLPDPPKPHVVQVSNGGVRSEARFDRPQAGAEPGKAEKP